MNQLQRILSKADVRISTLFWLPGVFAGPEHPAQDFWDTLIADDFICDYLDDDQIFAEPALIKLRDYLDEVADDSAEASPDPARVYEILAPLGGFIFCVETPEYTRVKPPQGTDYDDAYGFSWNNGHYIRWMYASNETNIAPIAIKWAEDLHAQDLARKAKT
jgi:hypothetical protein